MINNGNDNYLHPHHRVSLPNDCRSIFTDAVIANYASHDQQPQCENCEMLRCCEGQDVPAEENGLECCDVNS